MAPAVTDSDVPRHAPGSAAPAARGARQQPKVVLHIGEPKTGTTFLQQVIWRNRAELASQGVVLPGHHPQDHFRASQDLRGIKKLASDPAGAWDGEWDILASQSKQAPRVAVISHELFCAAEPDQAEQAVRSLQPAEVHVVLTVRDMATLLPAEWQETVKHRNAKGFEDWLADVIDHESVAADRRQWWFWRVHDTLEIAAIWSGLVPPGHVHVITTPPRGGDSSLLWRRFASLLEVDPGSVDVSRARSNASLGMPEIEFLRRLNSQLSREIPDWFYMAEVKERLAHQALAGRPVAGRLMLPAGRAAWASEQAEALIAGLEKSGCDVVGDLDELRPPMASQPMASQPEASQPEASPAAVSPAGEPAEQVLDAAVDATAALVLSQYYRAYPAAAPQGSAARQGGPARSAGAGGTGGPTRRSVLADRVASTVRASPRLKRAVRDLSSRHASVRQLRVLAWRALELHRARKEPAARGKQ